MNKYREAMNDIVDNGTTLEYFNKKAVLPQKENPIFIIQELVARATPKIVRHYRGFDDTYGYDHCPNCDAGVNSFINQEVRYCPYCGQALLWEKEGK